MEENTTALEITEVKKTFPPFGIKDKVGYAMGDFGCNMSFALNSYLMLFYTQYIGLSLEIWGVIILCLKIWDGINDPIMGGLMDSLKPGKRGKFKTYIFWGSFVLLVSGAMCFLPIPNAPLWVKIVVCVVGYLVWDMSYTVVNVPYGAMNAAISADPADRSQLSTWRSLGAFAANILIMALLPVLCYNDKNELLGGRMIFVALVLGVLGFFAFQVLLRATTERVVINDALAKPREKYNYFKALGAFMKNRAAVGVTLASIFSIIMLNGMSSATQILYQSFFQNSKISGVLTLISFAPMLIIMPFIKPIVQKFGKKEASAYPMIIGMAATLAMALLPITPDNTGLVIWIALSVLVSISVCIYSVVGWAMVADCIDYQELQTGQREEGTVYATYSLGRKLAQGFGASIIAFLLIATGYSDDLGAHQPAEVANNVRIMIGLVQFVCIALQFLCLRFIYNLNKSKVYEMEAKLGRTNADLIGKNEDED